MDELEWLKEHSPSTRPSRDVTRRHRTQVRAAIAAEGADGTRPRRPRRERRSRHRVLVTTMGVVALCAAGAGVIALASGGDDGGSTVGAPAASDAATTAPPSRACAGAPPKKLAIPAGFGNAVAAPAEAATAAPSSTQQVTSWQSDATTIEQRWPADVDLVAKFGVAPSGPADGSITSSAEQLATVDANGVAHRTILFSFSSDTKECSTLQVTVYGRDVGTVDTVMTQLIYQPFRSSEPLVTTTQAALVAPPVVACQGPSVKAAGMVAAVPVVPTIGGTGNGAVFAQPTDALTHLLATRRTLARSGFAEVHFDDSSLTYVKEVAGNVVTTVHVVPTKGGWIVNDWQASGC